MKNNNINNGFINNNDGLVCTTEANEQSNTLRSQTHRNTRRHDFRNPLVIHRGTLCLGNTGKVNFPPRVTFKAMLVLICKTALLI